MVAPNASTPSGPQGRITVAARPMPLPAPPRTKLERIREAAGEALFVCRRFAIESWQDFKRRDRFFKWKAAILATWIAISLLSIRIATSGPEDPGSNGLGAYLAITQTSMGWGLLVHNRSEDAWTAVRVELDGGWVHERPQIGAGEMVVLSPAQFARGGLQATDELSFVSAEIRTRQGSATPPMVR